MSHLTQRAVAESLGRHAIPCNRAGCERYAWWSVSVRVWAKESPDRKPENSAELYFPLAVCEECKAGLAVSDVVDDRGWRQMCQHLRTLGKATPDRSSLELTFKALPTGGSA